jgi:hypothetical protein
VGHRTCCRPTTRHAHALQGLLDAGLEDRLEPVPLRAGLAAHVAGHRAHLAGHRAQAFLGQALGLLLQRLAFLHQRLEHLAALGLGLGEGAHAGQPDLLRRVLDHRGELVVEQAGGVVGLVLGHLLEFPDHDAFLGAGVAPACTIGARCAAGRAFSSEPALCAASGNRACGPCALAEE